MNDAAIIKLIPKVVAGDHSSFGELYELTKEYVYRTVYFLYENKDDVDDITQEIYYQLSKSLVNYNTTKPFKPWLTSIIIKQISNARRKNWRFTRIVQRVFSIYNPIQTDHTDKILQGESHNEMILQINRLSPKLKEVILLKYIHELSQEQIAQILEIPLGTVKSRINSALEKLRKNNNIKQFIYEEENNHEF